MLARKLVAPNGAFLGVIGRGFEPIHFEKFFASVALGTDAAISMLHRNGTLLARYPHDDAVIGRNFRNGPLFRLIGTQPGPGTGIYVRPADGQERLGVAYALENFPVFVVASTTLSSALAPWREQMNFLIGVGGSSMLLIAALLGLAVRQLSRDHRRSESRLRLETQRLDRAVNNMTQGLLLFDRSQRLVVCNNRYIEMYGLSADVVKPGRSFRDVIAHRKATGSFVGDVGPYVEAVLRDIGRKKTTVIETSDGRFVQIVNEPVADGGWVATHEDITERRLAEQRITHLAHYDALTDLPNRTLFHEWLKQEIADILPGQRVAVHYIDIDEFKSVNDTLGHPVGDALLKSVALGVRIALDDFGTGYSSLSYLQRFPFEKIKIDRCFVDGIAEVDGSTSIVQAVVDLAAARRMKTTAEGVETEEQRRLLRSLGCTEMQGHLFSEARPLREINELIYSHRRHARASA